MPGPGISPKQMVDSFIQRITELGGGDDGPLDVRPFHSNIATDYTPLTNKLAVVLVTYGGSSYLGPARNTGTAQARLPRVVVMVGALDLSDGMAGVEYSRDMAESLSRHLRGHYTGTIRWAPQQDGYIGTGDNNVHWHQVVFTGTEQGVHS
jgi:hypothetical protein